MQLVPPLSSPLSPRPERPLRKHKMRRLLQEHRVPHPRKSPPLIRSALLMRKFSSKHVLSMISRCARRRLWRGTLVPHAWKRRVLACIATTSGFDHRALRRVCKIVRCRKRPLTCTRSAGRLNVCMPPIALRMQQHCLLQVARADHWHADWLKVSYDRRRDFLAFCVMSSTGLARRHSRSRCAVCLPKLFVI
jgi:hypothetical protein